MEPTDTWNNTVVPLYTVIIKSHLGPPKYTEASSKTPLLIPWLMGRTIEMGCDYMT